MKHTPGPWTLEYSPYGGEDFPIMIANKEWEIAHIRFDCDGSEANARLISAAPDLLEALSEMVSMMDSGEEHGTGSQWHTKAKAAIAKAKGEQK